MNIETSKELRSGTYKLIKICSRIIALKVTDFWIVIIWFVRFCNPRLLPRSINSRSSSDPEDQALAPRFSHTSSADLEVFEGDQLRVNCRVSGRPPPGVNVIRLLSKASVAKKLDRFTALNFFVKRTKFRYSCPKTWLVEWILPDIFWYLNGQRLIQDDRHRIIVNEAGCHALLLTSARLEDAGTISCLAKNGSGESAFQVIVFLFYNKLPRLSTWYKVSRSHKKTVFGRLLISQNLKNKAE